MTTVRVFFACLFLLCGTQLLPAQQRPLDPAQGKLETADQTNQRIHRLAQAFQPSVNDYVIGSGDLLEIAVFDVPDLSREVRVSASGYISLPLLPVRVRAAGLTGFQLEEKLAELLAANGLVTNPQVTVFIKEQRSHPITILGAVRNPAVHQAIRPVTLLEMLSIAGGIAEDAGSVVIVTRPAPPAAPAAEPAAESSASPAEPLPVAQLRDPGRAGGEPGESQTFVIRLKDLLESGDPRFNIPLYGGDYVTVPRAGIVYVVGAVARPGGFVMQSDSDEMTTLKALALAQGLTGTAKPHEAVILRKDPASGRQREIEINLKKVMSRKAEDTSLYANDVLFIPDSAGKKALRRLGEAALTITAGLVILRAGR